MTVAITTPGGSVNIATDLVGSDNVQVIKMLVGSSPPADNNALPVALNTDSITAMRALFIELSALLETVQVGNFPATQAVTVAGTVQTTGALSNTEAIELGLATAAKQDAQTAATALIGTRKYGTALARVAVGVGSTQSSAITAAEVMVHASTRCFIALGVTPTATNADIPLEAGEKFHLRVTSGHKIAVLRDTDDGFLNIVPVV